MKRLYDKIIYRCPEQTLDDREIVALAQQRFAEYSDAIRNAAFLHEVATGLRQLMRGDDGFVTGDKPVTRKIAKAAYRFHRRHNLRGIGK